MNFTNTLQWICIALSFVTPIYYFLNPRKLRRLFLHKVRYVHSDDRGNHNVYGYIVGWSVVLKPEPTPELNTAGSVKLKDIKNPPLHPHAYVVIEPAKPHPTLHYQNVIIRAENILFL